jgi:predicted nicotinamide N-methyase
MMPALDHADFVRANTEVLSPPLVPEVRLHLASRALPLWEKTEEELDSIGLPPPFWAFAWAGGQALARHILDHPHLVAGLDVLDLASGSGLVAIAAAKAGARLALAADIDPFAIAAIGLNAALNGTAVAVTGEDLLDCPAPEVGCILVGDLFYERETARRLLAWLERAADGRIVLVGDPGRSYLPRHRLEQMAEYRVPVTRDLEDADIKHTSVWRLAA